MTTDTLAEGTQVGDYRIEGLLGRSAIGQVYAAKHVLRDKRVALKVLAQNLVSRPAIAQRFLREGRAAARIRHENVIEIFEVGTVGRIPFIAMQLLKGESLARRFARGPLTVEELVAVMLPVLAAVATAHEMGVIHRDLKPEDIFLRQRDDGSIQPVVLNFGMSKLIGEASLPPMDARASGGSPMELPFYLAPEQVHGGRNVRGATDQYSLGVVMYEGATGLRPFEGLSLMDVVDKVLTGKYEPPDVANPAVPGTLSRVIARAMSMRVTDRYTSLWAMGMALLPLASIRDRDIWSDVFGRNTAGLKAAAATDEGEAPRVAAATAVVLDNEIAPRPVHPAAPASPAAPTPNERAGARRPGGRWLAMAISAAVLIALVSGFVAVMRAR